jgi:4-hydroxy-tetrahydrodipicolinate synthase
MRLLNKNKNYNVMNNSKYRGVVVPMVTPVTQDGRLDVEAVKRIIEFFAEAGVSPLLMGTTGEGNSVSQADGQLFVETAVKARNNCQLSLQRHTLKERIVNCQCSMFNVQYSMVIYAGLTGNCFTEQVRQAEVYTALGADVIVATLPTYYALTPEQMYDYYKTLADSITGPLMLYNILSTTHMSIPVDVIKRLADHPNIVGLKDSERDLERMAQCIEIAQGRDDFAYFCGWAAQSAHSLEQGGNGIVPSTGNYVPEMFRQLYDAAVAGDMATANRLQDETNEIAKIYQKDRTLGQSLTALKVMMQTKGLCEPWMLMPLTRLSAEEEQAIIVKLGIRN